MQAHATTRHDAPCIHLQAEGATALVALRGALVASWIPADGRERLFLGDAARLDGSMTVHGGVPVIFPQFAERGPLPHHGFARKRDWRFAGIGNDEAVFELDGNGGDAQWPHAFIARLRIGLRAMRLSIALEVDNTGDSTFDFTAALHTYLRVGDIAAIAIEGLQGCDYEDKVNGGTLHRQTDYELAIDDVTDRIYADVVAPLALVEGDASLAIEHDGFADAVIWNPGEAWASRLSDLSPGDWRRFVCVEAAQVQQPVVLAPGERWTGVQFLG
ncbi:MAG TPA: D-hexose-6-phosphate mutarotase [Thermomonas sp.]|nr:D-hexose-6-phosphate mutarotase [Thermomonas sp.]